MKTNRQYKIEGGEAFMNNVPFERCPYWGQMKDNWEDGWSEASKNYQAKLESQHREKPKTINTKRFLVFCGQEYYANGGAHDLVSTSCKTKEKAIKYADSLIGKEFTTNTWLDGDDDPHVTMTVEWAHIFDLVECKIIYSTGNVHGDESGIVIL